ncbi:Sortilin [Fodinibius salinus]|uniref:Sortilin n=1 Tax=Fodinibius salinus TaxID=860790 RepID=A0A5D3YJN5_9BACT|nr:glycosyl hydrolase [Fodinibius salinus]TYP93715.1 Sortilin [Fodinibius salinus]
MLRQPMSSTFNKALSIIFLVFFLFLGINNTAIAQRFGGNQMEEGVSDRTYSSSAMQELDYRNIGPFRGGRSVAVSGHPDQPDTYYAGFTGGGVYKTSDGGKNWVNISDGFFKTGSVGAITVAPSDPNIIYAGMGETCIRGNMSPGDGMYKSVDGGKTWTHIGLPESHFIGEIAVHPKDKDVAWVAVMGHAFGTEGNKERGVYKTTDGGKTWQKVLFHNKHTGAVDIEVDPNNPRILYASLWEAFRNPWKMSSGGKGSGLYKSTDGGETWKNISQRPGMPKGLLGKIGVAVSPVNSDRVWAIIENENGGVFRSDDNGKSWDRINSERNLRQRAWYYTHIMAGTESENEVYVLNVGFYKSTDGGSSFERIGTPHTDHHDLWIDPNNSDRMVVADDGGGQVTYNGGKSWSSNHKYSTAQFYQVITDNQFPYWIYGAQQDNSTVGIKNRTADYGIDKRDWHPVAGGESGYIAPDPENANVTYGGSYGGYFNKFNSFTNQSDRIDVWPDNPMGAGAKDLKYRFQWTFPIYISPHNPDLLYATSQFVHRSDDEGMSWDTISEDLTRNDKSKQEESGGPITKDDTSVEYYNTIFTFAESPVKQGVLWTGADDGLIHVSRDNGDSWTNVTPDGMPESLASIIDPSPHDAGTAYLAANRYKFDDFQPMLYKTTNYGKSWTKITDGIPKKDFTRVIREDPNKEGLLYAGTQTGVYVSFNDGEQWQPLQLNLPSVPVTDLAVHKREKDLVVATQGRSFWILDNLSVLHQLNDNVINSGYYLYKPETTYLFGNHTDVQPGQTLGENPEDGVVVHYNITDAAVDQKEVQLQFAEPDGDVIRTFSNQEDLDGNEVKKSEKFYEKEHEVSPDVLTTKQGQNKFVWNMRYPGATDLDGRQILWAGSTRGPTAVPGAYKVRLIVDGETVNEQSFKITKDPRIETTQDDFEAQFDLQQTIIAKLDTTHKTINRIREMRKELMDVKKEYANDKQIQDRIHSLLHTLSEVEGELMQTKAESFQDVLNYPIKLNNKLASLANTVGTGDGRPTEQQYAVYKELASKVDSELKKVEPILRGETSDLIEELEQESIPIEN